jgi:EF-P beta-lysylation protein EpmB
MITTMNNAAVSLIQSDIAEKWQQILADLITEPKELLEILQLDPTGNPLGETGLAGFSMKVPRPFAARMEKGNWADPLLRQVWPDRNEADPGDGLVSDPLQEQQFNVAPGVLHKYSGRVLLTAAPHCAIHCRYCFRRHFDYAANTLSRSQWQQSIDQIAADPSIHEVILSGGDPLANSDRQLDWLLGRLEALPQLTTLRIHTRLPVVIPQRVTAALVARLARSRLRAVLVVHVNHHQELDQACQDNFETLAANGITLLNQAVILAGVNDSYPALKRLGEALFQAHVLPYYLHLPDKVAGTAHFQVDASRAQDLIAQLRARLPGYLVPRLVREEPGQASKSPLA